MCAGFKGFLHDCDSGEQWRYYALRLRVLGYAIIKKKKKINIDLTILLRSHPTRLITMFPIYKFEIINIKYYLGI